MEKQSQYSHRRRVEFAETDMAGIVHFSNFFRWMEAAEADFFRALGEPLIGAEGASVFGWPRVRVSCAYHAPLRFGDEVEVRLTVKELKDRAIAYAFRFYRITGPSPEHIATGEMTTVFVRRPADGGAMQSMPLPDTLRAKLSEAQLEALKGT